MKRNRSVGEFRIFCNLGYDLVENEVKAYFQGLCSEAWVQDVYIPRHSSGRNKGYCFVTFQSEADLLTALKRPEHVINGTTVAINRAGPRPEPPPHSPTGDGLVGELEFRPSVPPPPSPQRLGKGPRLYIGGVPDTLSEDAINKHFQRWGNVVDIYFPGKKGRKRVNYCFVAFENLESAQLASAQSGDPISGYYICNERVSTISIAEERKAPTTAPWTPLGTLGTGDSLSSASSTTIQGGLPPLLSSPDLLHLAPQLAINPMLTSAMAPNLDSMQLDQLALHGSHGDLLGMAPQLENTLPSQAVLSHQSQLIYSSSGPAMPATTHSLQSLPQLPTTSPQLPANLLLGTSSSGIRGSSAELLRSSDLPAMTNQHALGVPAWPPVSPFDSLSLQLSQLHSRQQPSPGPDMSALEKALLQLSAVQSRNNVAQQMGGQAEWVGW